MNHNLRSIEALSRGFSRPLKRGTEIGCCRRSYRDRGPRQPGQLFLPRNVSIFCIPLTTIFAIHGSTVVTLFLQLPPKYNAFLSTETQRTEFRYRNLFNNSVETIVDSDQASLNFLFTPWIVQFNWKESISSLYYPRYPRRRISSSIFLFFLLFSLPFLLRINKLNEIRIIEFLEIKKTYGNSNIIKYHIKIYHFIIG